MKKILTLAVLATGLTSALMAADAGTLTPNEAKKAEFAKVAQIKDQKAKLKAAQETNEKLKSSNETVKKSGDDAVKELTTEERATQKANFEKIAAEKDPVKKAKMAEAENERLKKLKTK